MDNYLPPVVRDNRLFMYPFFWYWFKGKNIRTCMDFKKVAWEMTDNEFLDFYKELDCRAKERKTDLNEASIKFMLKKLPFTSGSLLDVGCGLGHWLQLLREQTSTELTGCDVFDSLNIHGVTYIKGSIEKLPFEDNSFDIVTCHHTIEHVRDLSQAVRELKRVARKQLIVVTPRQRYNYLTLDLHLHFFPMKHDLIKLFDIKDYQCQDCDGDWCYIGNLQ